MRSTWSHAIKEAVMAVVTEVASAASSAPKFRWWAVFAGVFVSLGLWVLLYTLGLANGLSSIEPGDMGSARAAGIGTGIWTLIAPLIALCIGGMVGARVAGIIDRASGAIHGAVLWGV